MAELAEYGRMWQETRSSAVTRPVHDITLINPATM